MTLDYAAFVLSCNYVALFIFVGLTHAAPDEPFTATGSVIKNHDGDTIKLQTPDRGLLTVRFAGSDTPETGQAYWRESRVVYYAH